MKRITISCLLLSLYCGSVSAQEAVDSEKEQTELLEIHRTDRRAHFETDARLLVKNSAEEFIAVSNGKIDRTTRAQSQKFFEDYFENAKYYEWDDLEAPIIRISKDSSMAWMITRTKIRRSQKSAAGEEKERSFIYAGIMTYEKQNGKWIRLANVSTFE